MLKLNDDMTREQHQDIADKMVSTTYKKIFTLIVTAAGFLFGFYEIGERWLDKLDKKFEAVKETNNLQTSRLDKQEIIVQTLQEQTRQNTEYIKFIWEDNTRRRPYPVSN